MLRWRIASYIMNLNTPAEHHNINAASQIPEKIVFSYHTLDYVKCQQFQSLVTPNSQRVAYTEIINVARWSWMYMYIVSVFLWWMRVFTLNETLPASVSNVHAGFVSFTCGCTGISNSLTTYICIIFLHDNWLSLSLLLTECSVMKYCHSVTLIMSAFATMSGSKTNTMGGDRVNDDNMVTFLKNKHQLSSLP